MSDPCAPSVPLAPAEPAAAVPPARLLAAVRTLAFLTTAAMVLRHDVAAVFAAAGENGDPAGLAGDRWPWLAAHLLAGLAACALGERLLALCHPLCGLGAQAAGGNRAAAMQAAAHALCAAMLAGACFGGLDAPSLKVGAVFFGLALAATLLLALAHRAVTRFKDHEEIADGNLTVALASGGLHLGLALLAARAASGDFTDWKHSLAAFGLALLWALSLWPLRQVVLARFVLGMSPRELDHAQAALRRTDLGALEGGLYLLAALALGLA